MRSFKILAVMICAALLFCGCGKSIDRPAIISETVATDPPPEKPAYPISFDSENFEAAPESVASLSPALTEMLFDIGVSDRLVAVSDYCDYPAGAQNIAKIGSPASPDIDAIIELAPELLITQSPIAATDKLQLRQAGVRVLTLEPPKTYAGLCEIYIKLSMVFYGAVDYQTVYSQAISGLDAQMSAAQALGVSKSFVVVEAECDEGLLLSTKETLSVQMLSVFGYDIREGDDIFTADKDELFELAPEVVFYASGLDEDDIRDVFPRSKLIGIDFERFERPTVRLADVISRCIIAFG